MVIREPKKAASTSVLVVVAQPRPALNGLVAYLEARIVPLLDRGKAFKQADLIRFRITLTAFVKAIATNALASIPRHHGVSIAFGEGRYIGSKISPTALRHIRHAMAQLGYIAVGNWFFDKAKPEKSYCTRIRHTWEFRDLCVEYGLRLPDLIEPPVAVIAPLEGLEMPADITASADTIRAYNNFIRGFDLTLANEDWIELERMVVKGGTNGKGDKLHRGFNEGRIYLTRRFSESFDRGGRLYDPHYQGMPKLIRARLRINGEPTVELDFARIHPTILYAEKGLKLDIDPYDVPGYPEMVETGKETFNRLLNGKRKPSYRPKKDRKWFGDANSFNAYREAMTKHLSAIYDTFSRDYGARLQKKDGELCIAIIATCMAHGIPVYPVHDSFIVPTSRAAEVRSIMSDQFKSIFDIDCKIK